MSDAAATNDEAELLMALYARYGLAAHYCAMIEWDVLTLMMAAALRDGRTLPRADVDRLLEGAYKDLLDDLIADLAGGRAFAIAAADVGTPASIPIGFAEDLHGAFDVRRRLAGYFREKTLQVLNLAGRVKMVQELNADCQRLQRTHESVRAVVQGILTRHALVADTIADELRRLLGFAKQEVS